MNQRSASSLLISEPPLQVLPTLATLIGLNEAIFLQQLHYWLQKPSAHEIEGQRWVYNTITQWQEQLPFWSERTLKRIIAEMVQSGLILRKNFNKDKRDRTWWYAIDYSVLDAIFDEGYSKIRYGTLDSDKLALSTSGQVVTVQSDNLAPSINKDARASETSSEITSERHTQNARACEADVSETEAEEELATDEEWCAACDMPTNAKGILNTMDTLQPVATASAASRKEVPPAEACRAYREYQPGFACKHMINVIQEAALAWWPGVPPQTSSAFLKEFRTYEHLYDAAHEYPVEQVVKAAQHWKQSGEKLRLPLFFSQIASTLANAQSQEHGADRPRTAEEERAREKTKRMVARMQAEDEAYEREKVLKQQRKEAARVQRLQGKG